MCIKFVVYASFALVVISRTEEINSAPVHTSTPDVNSSTTEHSDPQTTIPIILNRISNNGRSIGTIVLPSNLPFGKPSTQESDTRSGFNVKHSDPVQSDLLLSNFAIESEEEDEEDSSSQSDSTSKEDYKTLSIANLDSRYEHGEEDSSSQSDSISEEDTTKNREDLQTSTLQRSTLNIESTSSSVKPPTVDNMEDAIDSTPVSTPEIFVQSDFSASMLTGISELLPQSLPGLIGDKEFTVTPNDDRNVQNTENVVTTEIPTTRMQDGNVNMGNKFEDGFELLSRDSESTPTPQMQNEDVNMESILGEDTSGGGNNLITTETPTTMSNKFEEGFELSSQISESSPGLDKESMLDDLNATKMSTMDSLIDQPTQTQNENVNMESMLGENSNGATISLITTETPTTMSSVTDQTIGMQNENVNMGNKLGGDVELPSQVSESSLGSHEENTPDDLNATETPTIMNSSTDQPTQTHYGNDNMQNIFEENSDQFIHSSSRPTGDTSALLGEILVTTAPLSVQTSQMQKENGNTESIFGEEPSPQSFSMSTSEINSLISKVLATLTAISDQTGKDSNGPISEPNNLTTTKVPIPTAIASEQTSQMENEDVNMESQLGEDFDPFPQTSSEATSERNNVITTEVTSTPPASDQILQVQNEDVNMESQLGEGIDPFLQPSSEQTSEKDNVITTEVTTAPPSSDQILQSQNENINMDSQLGEEEDFEPFSQSSESTNEAHNAIITEATTATASVSDQIPQMQNGNVNTESKFGENYKPSSQSGPTNESNNSIITEITTPIVSVSDQTYPLQNGSNLEVNDFSDSKEPLSVVVASNSPNTEESIITVTPSYTHKVVSQGSTTNEANVEIVTPSNDIFGSKSFFLPTPSTAESYSNNNNPFFGFSTNNILNQFSTTSNNFVSTGTGSFNIGNNVLQQLSTFSPIINQYSSPRTSSSSVSFSSTTVNGQGPITTTSGNSVVNGQVQSQFVNVFDGQSAEQKPVNPTDGNSPLINFFQNQFGEITNQPSVSNLNNQDGCNKLLAGNSVSSQILVSSRSVNGEKPINVISGSNCVNGEVQNQFLNVTGGMNRVDEVISKASTTETLLSNNNEETTDSTSISNDDRSKLTTNNFISTETSNSNFTHARALTSAIATEKSTSNVVSPTTSLLMNEATEAETTELNQQSTEPSNQKTSVFSDQSMQFSEISPTGEDIKQYSSTESSIPLSNEGSFEANGEVSLGQPTSNPNSLSNGETLPTKQPYKYFSMLKAMANGAGSINTNQISNESNQGGHVVFNERRVHLNDEPTGRSNERYFQNWPFYVQTTSNPIEASTTVTSNRFGSTTFTTSNPLLGAVTRTTYGPTGSSNYPQYYVYKYYSPRDVYSNLRPFYFYRPPENGGYIAYPPNTRGQNS